MVPSDDASLSALDLTWDDGGTETDIALAPPFSASTTAYTASVANGVDRVTIDGTENDIGAQVDYFDGADSALTDADGNAAGFQVDLAVGATTIKAKVAASDGETTRDLHGGGDAGGGRHDGAVGDRRHGGPHDAHHRLRRDPRRCREPRQRRVRSEEDPVRRLRGDRRAQRVALDQRLCGDADARRGGGVDRRRDGELHEADLGHGERARGCRRQRGRRLRGPGGHEQYGGGAPCLVPERARRA